MENTEKKGMPLLGDKFPELQVVTTRGVKNLPGDYRGKWFVLFSHPADFTPVCTTELSGFALEKDFFAKMRLAKPFFVLIILVGAALSIGYAATLEQRMQNGKYLGLKESVLYISENVGDGEMVVFEAPMHLYLNTGNKAVPSPEIGEKVGAKYAIVDEIDTGLDVDALKTVATALESLSNDKTGILIITHYQRILRYVKPDVVHVLVAGKIVDTGDHTLAKKIESKGYSTYLS